MTSTELAALAGIIFSLGLNYIPGLSVWFASKSPEVKSMVVGLLTLAVAAGALLYNCNLGAECITANWRDYATAVFVALVASQATYGLSPQTSKVKEAKAERVDEEPVKPSEPPVAKVAE